MTTAISRRRFLKMTGPLGAIGLVSSYPFFIERYLVATNTYRIPVPRLPPAFAGLRVVHLSDLHFGALMPMRVIADVIRRANELGGDLIVCTGDYVHERNAARQIDAVWPELARLSAPLGVHSVLGNHDHWADTARSEHWLEQTGQGLRHRVAALEKDGQQLWLAGAGDLWEDHRRLDDLLARIPDAGCRIVLAHNPDTADTPFAGRADLMISGHTHGGQVRLPFLGAPILPVRNKRYSSGLCRSPRGLGVFISRGIGWAYLPVRFNCLPEIAVLELRPA
ncbi:MAG TPA: metallophosphoesterase [Kiritimatiellia bacterium]|nr:metallophosphoesterase [Kiritimatiellia bacterium]HRZ11291.1 metallophosphoesterase [Kiritimatiellia bacterium]HSA19770.1 metallophosphoesterase [Kiritimatiellia bacterium]